MGCTRSPFSGGLRCCAFCTGPVNPDVIRLENRSRMKVVSLRSVCAATSLACFVLAFLIAIYLFAAGAFWVMPENVALKLTGAAALVLSLYFGSCAAFKRLLWLRMFQSKVFLNALGAMAAIGSVCFLLSAFQSLVHMDPNWLHVALPALLTFLAAVCIRAGTGWSAFGIFSLLYSLPLGLLSIGPLSYMLFPPPPDPVGGNAINAGIVMMLMIPFACTALPTWIASMFVERWRAAWHILIGLLCLPGSVVVASFLPQIVG